MGDAMKREIWKRTINILKEMASKMGEQLTLVFVYTLITLKRL